MNELKPSRIVLLVSGAVLFLASFFAFFRVSAEPPYRGSQTWSAWSGDVGLTPLSFFPALLGLIAAVVVALVAFGNVNLPERLVTLSWPQVFFALGFAAFFILFGLMLSIETGGGFGFGFGFWLQLLASVGVIVGSVMELNERATA